MPRFITSLTATQFRQTFDKLKEILESESECATEWFTRNGMLFNPDKYKPFVIDKKKTTQMKRCKLATTILKLYYQLNY